MKSSLQALTTVGGDIPERTSIAADHALFESLLRKLSPTLKRITRKLNGHFSFMDHEDLFQEAAMHLWSHFNCGDLDDKTDSYILQGCYFHLRNYIRKTQDSATLLSLHAPFDEDGTRLEDVLLADDLASYDQLEGGFQIEALEASGMTRREREVLLFCLEGMTTREIGKKLNISHVSVVKARKKIQDRYLTVNGAKGNRTDGGNGGDHKNDPACYQNLDFRLV